MKDGYIWGRGSKDDKPVLAANLMAMLMLKRLGIQLDRDVIFLAESGEEADLEGVGINYMVREHFAEIDAEFAMTEGGGARIDGGRVTRVSIGTAEKLPARVRLVARGTAGHGSVPRLDNALMHLGRCRRQGWPVGDADAAQRHHARLLREDGGNQPAGTRVNL
jgi:acetylornithine deacetylase/succinyl-diaminopimelate desuccinylase-like protein